MIPEYNPYFMPFLYPYLPPDCIKPPTLYTILNSMVNGRKSEDDPNVMIKNLAKEGRRYIFNFNYPLSDKVNKEEFEVMILNHYLMRRIGFENVTAFRIALDAKLNEIMPLYNKMLDSFADWDIFKSGEKTVRTGTDNTDTTNSNTMENQSETSSETQSNGITKNSELPQSQISNIHNDSYLTNYGETENSGNDSSQSSGTSSGTSNGTSKKIYTETIERSPADKIAIMKEMQTGMKSIYTMIFKDLDLLFYSLG